MTSLMDIAPSNRTVETSFGKVDVPGLSLNSLVSIVKRHPTLIQLMQENKMEFSYDQILDLGLDIAASFLAAGLGYAGDEKAEERCKKLNPEDAFNLGQAILEESFPKGPKSFFDKVSALMEKANLKVQDTQSSNSSLKLVNGL